MPLFVGGVVHHSCLFIATTRFKPVRTGTFLAAREAHYQKCPKQSGDGYTSDTNFTFDFEITVTA